jgi:hypothetical protein
MRVATWKIAAFLTSTLLIALLAARQIGESQSENDFYQVTEWRIFYPGHFIRRGLRGSFVEWLSQLTCAPPAEIVRSICTVSYAVVTVAFTVYLFRWLWNGARGRIPLFLLSPAGFFFYQDAILSIDRFDIFFLLLTIVHLEICLRTRGEKQYVQLSVAVFATFGVVAVLCHEAFLLLCLPINAMLSTWRLGGWDGRQLLIFGLPLIAGSFCVFSRVTPTDIIAISRALDVPIGSFEWYNGPIFLLAISPVQQVEVVASFFSVDAVWPFLITAILFGIIHFSGLRRVVSASDLAEPTSGWIRPERLWRDLLWIPFFCTLPMYVVAADYGRWFAMIVATFTICCARLLKLRAPVKRVSRGWAAVALVIFLFVPMPLSLRFPHMSPQLLSWSGAATLGHFFAPPVRRVTAEHRIGDSRGDPGAIHHRSSTPTTGASRAG